MGHTLSFFSRSRLRHILFLPLRADGLVLPCGPSGVGVKASVPRWFPQSQRDLAIRQGQAYYLSKEKIHIVPVYLKTFQDKVVTPLTKYLIQKPKYEIIKHSQ